MAELFFWHPTSAIGTTIPPNTEILSVSGAICKIIDIFWRLEDAGTRQKKVTRRFDLSVHVLIDKIRTSLDTAWCEDRFMQVSL